MSTLRQYCDDASSTALIRSNGITPKWVATLFRSDCIVFNESSIASIDAHAWYKWTPKAVFTPSDSVMGSGS